MFAKRGSWEHLMTAGFGDETNVPLAALGAWRFWPLRFVLFFVVLTGACVGSQLLALLVPKQLTFIPVEASTAAFVLLGIAILITVYRLLVRWTEKRGTPELSANRALSHLLGGVALGLAMFCSVIAIDVALGGARIQGFGGFGGVTA